MQASGMSFSNINHYQFTKSHDLLEGWTGIACEDYIRSFVTGGTGRRTRVVIVPSGISEYVKNRVFIQCDKFGNVIQAPARG